MDFKTNTIEKTVKIARPLSTDEDDGVNLDFNINRNQI